MPELPEVETVRRALLPHLQGARLGRVRTFTPSLRHPLDAEALSRHIRRRAVRDLRRLGKYLVLELTSQRALLLHLGMSGAFRVVPSNEPVGPHERYTIGLGGSRELRFVDPRRFGVAEPVDLPDVGSWPDELAHLGPDALDASFDGDRFYEQSRSRSTPTKVLLLDQGLVAGIGNIYANEACYRSKIRPARQARRLTRPECARLVQSARAVLQAAIKQGGTTLRDHRQVDGSEGRFRIRLAVYGRDGEPCRRRGCDGTVRRTVLSGRGTFHCPVCQR